MADKRVSMLKHKSNTWRFVTNISKKHLLNLAEEILESKVLTAMQKKKLAFLIKNKNVGDLDAFICDNGDKVYRRLMALLPKIPK